LKNYIVASTISLLSEGNDIPSLEKILLAATTFPPFTDVGRMQQVIGRAVRPDPNNKDKKPAIVIIEDHLSGWIKDKRDIVMDHIEREFKPNIVSFLELIGESHMTSLFEDESPYSSINRPY
jgi:superfamily II DNA or RNA helicase